MTKEAQTPKLEAEMRRVRWIGGSDFGILSSFVIRLSSFVFRHFPFP
jgi:hypothetical protein